MPAPCMYKVSEEKCSKHPARMPSHDCPCLEYDSGGKTVQTVEITDCKAVQACRENGHVPDQAGKCLRCGGVVQATDETPGWLDDIELSDEGAE